MRHHLPIRVSLCASPRHVQFVGAYNFPAILDTGFNGALAITMQQRVDWAAWSRSDIADLRRRQRGRGPTLRGASVLRCESSVWIHPNRPHSWDTAERESVRLRCDGGILVLDNQSAGEVASQIRLPLIGMKLFEQPGRKCRLQIDFAARLVQLRV